MFFIQGETAYSWWKLPQLCLQAQIFDFHWSCAGVLQHGHRKVSSRTLPHVASHSFTSLLDSNGLFPLLQPKPHCISAVLININQM